MPVIDKFQSQHGVIPTNPGEAQVNPTQFGRDMEGLAQVGKQVQDIGAKWLESRSRAEDADHVMRTQQAAMDDFSKKSKDLLRDYTNVDPETGETLFDPRGKPSKDDVTGEVTYPDSYSAKMRQLVNDRFRTDMEGMPSQRAANAYRTSMDGVLNHYITASNNIEDKGVTDLFYRNRDRYVQQGTQTLYRDPSLQNFHDQVASLASYDAANKDVLYDSERAAKAHDQSVRDLAHNGLLRGYLDTDPQKGLALIQGEPKGPYQMKGPEAQAHATLMKYLKGDDLADWTEKFQHKIHSTSLVEVQQLENRLKDYKAAATMGEARGGLRGALDMIDRQEALGAFKTKEDKLRAASDAIGAMVVGEAKKGMAGMTNQQIMQSDAKFEGYYRSQVQRIAKQEGIVLPPDFAAGDLADVRRHVQAEAVQTIKDRTQDPAGFIASTNDAVAKLAKQSDGGLSPSTALNEQYFAAVEGEAGRLGAPKAVLSKTQVNVLAAQLTNSNGFESAKKFNEIQQKTGKYFPQVMNQLIKQGDVPEYYAVAGYMDDLDAQRSIIDGMRNKGSFEKVLADKNLMFRKNEVESAIGKEFQPYWNAIVSEGQSSENVKIAEGLRQAALYDAANRIARGASASDAASQAVDSIIRNKNEVYKGAILPKKGAEPIKSQMDLMSSKDFVEKNIHNFYLPSVLDAKVRSGQFHNESDYTAIRNEKTSRLMSALRDDNAHRWLTNPDGSGATLNLYDPEDRMFKPLRTMDGKNVEINWKDGRLTLGK